MKALAKLATVVIFGLVLSACGGGGDGSGADTGAGSNPGSSGAATITYTVTPSVNGVGGTVNPVGAVPVQAGATAAFTLTPDDGYYVKTVDGNCGGTLDSNNVYTTPAITADCTVAATFAVAPRYEAFPLPTSSDSFLSMLNAEGIRGYRYLGFFFFSNTMVIFVNDDAALSYTYDLLLQGDNYYNDDDGTARMILLLNQEGAKGYLYEDDVSFRDLNNYSIFRKDGNSLNTYIYAADLTPRTRDDWLTQANGRGQSGYWLYRTLSFCQPQFCRIRDPIGSVPPVSWNFYVKNNASSATYVYDAQPSQVNNPLLQVSDPVAQLAQLNSEGANGYRWVSGLGNIMFYIKDQTQAATFTYVSEETLLMSYDTANTDFVDQLNLLGTRGYVYHGNIFSYNLDGGGVDNYYTYLKASDCSGFLCTASHIFSWN